MKISDLLNTISVFDFHKPEKAQSTEAPSTAKTSDALFNRVEATGFDQVGVAGKPVTLSAKFNTSGIGPLKFDLPAGKAIEFFINGKSIGSARTDNDGTAKISYTPAEQGRYSMTYRVMDAGSSSPIGNATLYVDPPRPTIVFDIDGTLSNYPDLKVPFSGDKAPPFEKSPEVLRELAKSYNIVYLTARDEALTGVTREFLAKNNFPPGAVFFDDLGIETAKKLSQLDKNNHGIFKAEMIASMQQRGINIVAGVGNASTDAKAYELSGIKSFIFAPGYDRPVQGDHAVEIPDSTIFHNYTDLAGLISHTEAPMPLSDDRRAMLELVHYGDDDKVRNVTYPQLATASPDEKAALINRLLDGATTDRDERAILRILRTESRNVDRFDRIIKLVGLSRLEDDIDGKEYADFKLLLKQVYGKG